MQKGKTKSGFEYEFNEDLINDMEVIDALAEVANSENILAVSTVVKKLLSAEDRKRLYDHVRLEDGRVPADALMEELSEMMSGSDEGKKSLNLPTT